MDKEEQLLKNRLNELAKIAEQRNIAAFTDFLNLNEQNIFHKRNQEFGYVTVSLFGGYEAAERQMIAFIPDALSYEVHYPITVLKIKPSHEKYAESLTHRDFLGSMLGLGIERSKIGDILVDMNVAYVFCHKQLEHFFLEHLTKVKHTLVTIEETSIDDFIYTPHFKEIKGSIASLRIDAILSLACSQSRSNISAWITQGKVFCNGRLVQSNSFLIKEMDRISIRGFGKFIFSHVISTTKKGRIMVLLKQYL